MRPLFFCAIFRGSGFGKDEKMASEQLKNYLRNNCHGRKKALKSRKLEQTLHVSKNELQRQVNRLRRNEVPICSGPEGYFYARNASEIDDTIRSLEIMVHGMLQSIDGLKGAMKKFGEERDGAGTDG